jgi:hypothetical protein
MGDKEQSCLPLGKSEDNRVTRTVLTTSRKRRGRQQPTPLAVEYAVEEKRFRPLFFMGTLLLRENVEDCRRNGYGTLP